MGLPWPWAQGSPPLEKLGHPPIREVICGFVFDPLPLDPVVIGEYSRERASDFPRHQLQPAVEVAPEPGFVVQFGPVPPLRVWLISADDSLLLQIQHDRFYVNWRARGAAYPRFSGPDGLRQRTLSELKSFIDFAKRVTGDRPTLRQLELGKVDHMLEGEGWTGTGDLAKVVPILRPLLEMAAGQMPQIAIRLDDRVDGGALSCKIDTTLALRRANPPEPVRGIKLETQVTLALPDDAVADHLDSANTVVNAAFARLVPQQERAKRFGGLP